VCRNITVLRGLEPPATAAEIDDAARQFIRKIGGITTPGLLARPDVVRAIDLVSAATKELLEGLPPRRGVAPDHPGRRRRTLDDGDESLRDN
jgi:hypothetical protein